jgi:hypothetical protein
MRLKGCVSGITVLRLYCCDDLVMLGQGRGVAAFGGERCVGH